jgi:hypothetical protein
MNRDMENEKLRGLLGRTYTSICHLRDVQNLDTIKGMATAEALQEVVDSIDAALSQQAEPVEPAPVQDEREAFEQWSERNHFGVKRPFANSNNYASGYTQFCWQAWQARAALAAQGGAE